MKFKITIEEEITAVQRSIVIIEANSKEEACNKVCNGEGETIDCTVIDNYGPNGSSCDVVRIEYED